MPLRVYTAAVDKMTRKKYPDSQELPDIKPYNDPGHENLHVPPGTPSINNSAHGTKKLLLKNR